MARCAAADSEKRHFGRRNRPLRVVMLSAYFPPTAGGVESVGAFLCDYLARNGISTTVLTTTAQQLPEESSLPYAILRAPIARQRWDAIRRADVVIFNSPMLGWAPKAFLLRKPRLTIIHGWIRDPRGPRLDGIAAGVKGLIQRAKLEVGDLLREQLLRSGTHVVSVSRDAAKQTAPKATVIHNSYRSEIFRETTPPAERPVGSIIFVGRLVRGKGVEVLLDALALARKSAPQLHLTIVGDGPLRTLLEQHTVDRGVADHVRFTGALRGPAVNDALNGARIAVLPSTSSEGFPVTAIEAQAAGCAVIASDVPGMGEAVEDAGVLVTPSARGDLAAAIVRISEDPEMFDSLVDASRRNALAHSPDVLLGQYIEIIEELARR